MHLAATLSTTSDSGFALALAVVLAVIFLVVLRLVDMNEKEPAWALLMALVIGAIGALVLSAMVSARSLNATVLKASVADEVTIFVTLIVTVALLEAIGRVRGWSEINGPMDGIVYGAAVGLGFATGEAFVHELNRNLSALAALGLTSPLRTLWPTILFGFAGGLFGGVQGAGFGWGVDRPLPVRAALAVGGLVLAFGLQVGYLALARANGLGGSGSVADKWIALLVPAAVLLILMIVGLRSERAAIATALVDDPVAVTPEELRTLTNPHIRRAAYLQRLLAFDHHGWVGLRSLQNRLVQLALTKQRAQRTSDPAIRAQLDAEVAHLRTAVEAARAHLRTGSGVATTAQAQS